MKLPDAPYDAAIPFAQALLQAYPQRVLWGTDWPHPNIAGPAPHETELLRLLRVACGDEETWWAVLANNPRRLSDTQRPANPPERVQA